MSTPHNSPDSEGLAIAREIQDRLRPAEVILFGSRADGSHSPGHRGPHRHSPGRGRRRTDEGDSPGNPGRTARHVGGERHNDDPGGVPAVGPAGPILRRAGRPLRRYAGRQEPGLPAGAGTHRRGDTRADHLVAEVGGAPPEHAQALPRRPLPARFRIMGGPKPNGGWSGLSRGCWPPTTTPSGSSGTRR